MNDLIKRDDAPEPCPFCRGEAEVFEWEDGNYPTMSARVECECGAKGKCCGAGNRLGQLDAQNGLHRQRAIAAWNTRALPATDPTDHIEELEAKLTKAVETLREFAKQKRTTEMDVDEYDQADIEGAYCQFIFKARATLAELEAKE